MEEIIKTILNFLTKHIGINKTVAFILAVSVIGTICYTKSCTQTAAPILYNHITIPTNTNITTASSTKMQGVINDKDGYTNLRSSKSYINDNNIIKKIREGEIFEIINYSVPWCYVKTKDNKEGYVYHNRIKIIESN
jgi:hypothetical protein